MEQESIESSSSFYFNKSKKKGEKVNSEEWCDKLSKNINSFMTTQAQNEKSFLRNYLVKNHLLSLLMMIK